MVTRQQEAMEQPVKGYELAAVTKEVSDLREYTKVGFDEIKETLKTIVANTQGIATCKYVDEEIYKAKREVLDEVDLKYGSTKSGTAKFKWIVVTGLVGVVMQIITFVILWGFK